MAQGRAPEPVPTPVTREQAAAALLVALKAAADAAYVTTQAIGMLRHGDGEALTRHAAAARDLAAAFASLQRASDDVSVGDATTDAS